MSCFVVTLAEDARQVLPLAAKPPANKVLQGYIPVRFV